MTVLEKQTEFFAYARERHTIYLKRADRRPWPWTDDPILRTYRFCNVFRELDKTTEWFRINVRWLLRDTPQVLLATVLFRWFNKIEIGEVIFKQISLLMIDPDDRGWHTPWEHFLGTGDATPIRVALRSAFPDGPYVTGSYLISSPAGMDKLTGIQHLCEQFYRDSNWRAVADFMLRDGGRSTLEGFSCWLEQTPGLGAFMAYEVATDLRHTDLLCNAPDIMTWCNIGPGCRRGLNRIYDRTKADPRSNRDRYGAKISEEQALAEMAELLAMSRDNAHWPQSGWTGWPEWEMRDIEHTLCEFDKYNRVLNNEGTPRQLYRPQS